MDLYREQILDHYKHPRNFGHLEGANVTSEEINVSCGDRIVIELKLKGKGSAAVIEAIRFNGEGCAIDQASASMLTEAVMGMGVAKVMTLDLAYVEKMLGTTLTPSRVKCALLPLEAIQKAVQSVR
ncbi:iron-sulfur cluster assembly scaffold protein [Candidatus Gottesmanbacteria bacterium]|nr:iron-sulfur cluster assembly scaffold protein [Candidatus Gottesmanbacteria bacterium]